MGTSYWNFQFSPVLESSRHVDFQEELRIDRVKLGCKFTTDRLPKYQNSSICGKILLMYIKTLLCFQS